MPFFQTLLGYLGSGLLAATLTGLARTGRYRLWYSFTLCLAVIFAASAAIGLSSRFHSPSVWKWQELVVDVLRMAMALELALRIFRDFPGARAKLRWVLVLVGAATLVVIARAPHGADVWLKHDQDAYEAFVSDLQPRVLNGAVWLFTGIAFLVLWYRLPIHPFHKAVLLSYVPYLLIFTTALKTLGALGWERGWYVRYANQLAYAALVGFWTHAAWRRESRPPHEAAASPGSAS